MLTVAGQFMDTACSVHACALFDPHLLSTHSAPALQQLLNCHLPITMFLSTLMKARMKSILLCLSFDITCAGVPVCCVW